MEDSNQEEIMRSDSDDSGDSEEVFLDALDDKDFEISIQNNASGANQTVNPISSFSSKAGQASSLSTTIPTEILLSLRDIEELAKFKKGLEDYQHEMSRWFNFALMYLKAFLGFNLNLEKYKLVNKTLKELNSLAMTATISNGTIQTTSAIFSQTNNLATLTQLQQFKINHVNTIKAAKKLTANATEIEINKYTGRLGKKTNVTLTAA